MPVDKSEARIQQMFGAIAARYDFLNHFLSLGTDRYWRWRTVRRVRPAAEGPILDVCTGTGDLAFAFAKASPQGVNVIGADFCREMLDVAETKRKRRPRIADRVTFVEADAQRLPFDDGRFQIVSVAFGLRNVCNPDAALAEFARVLRPGGRLAVLEFSMPTVQPLKGLYGWYFRSVLPRVGRTLSNDPSRAYEYLPESVQPYASTFNEYGTWRNVDTYGYVWYPRVSVGWRPYYRGRWTTLRPWGWTPFTIPSERF